MNWDDFRLLRAFADGGTLAAAARRLGVDSSTVSRRLQELERDLEAQLLARTPRGLELTAAGQLAVSCARQMGDALRALQDAVSGADARVAGVVRISCSEAFSSVVVECLAQLHADFPDLRLEFSHKNAAADVRQREADVAVRMFRDRRDGLLQRKLGELGWSLYASASYVQAHGRPSSVDDLAGHVFVGYGDGLEKAPGAVWLASKVDARAVVARAGSTQSVCENVRQGAGISALPCWLGSAAGLVRLTDESIALTEVFAVYAPEMKSVARVQAVVERLAQAFRVRKDWLYGGQRP